MVMMDYVLEISCLILFGLVGFSSVFPPFWSAFLLSPLLALPFVTLAERQLHSASSVHLATTQQQAKKNTDKLSYSYVRDAVETLHHGRYYVSAKSANRY